MPVVITGGHLVYLALVITIIAFIAMKKDSVLLVIFGIFIIGLITTKSVVTGIQGVYNSVFIAASGMLVIPLLIAVIFALSQLLKKTGSDYLMVAPVRGILGHPAISFWVLGIVMFVLSLFFWPTPAAGLVGAILVPVAVAAGMTPLAAAVPVAMFGHGGALSGDWVLQAAPTILGNSSGLPVAEILSTSAYIVGGSLAVASIVAFVMLRKELVPAVKKDAAAAVAATVEAPEFGRSAKFGAIIVPIVLVIDVFLMVNLKLIGGDATSLLGGSVFVLIAILSIAEFGAGEALSKIVDYLKQGFVFAFEIFAPVFVMAALFMIGSPEGAATVFGEGAPGYMVELGQYVANLGAVNKPLLAIVQAVVSGMTGLDGAGFDQLPLVGSLARSLAPGIGANPVPLACLGQMISIWTAGALVPWGFMACLAGFCGVSPLDLARKSFIPTMVGFTVGIIITIFLL